MSPGFSKRLASTLVALGFPHATPHRTYVVEHPVLTAGEGGAKRGRISAVASSCGNGVALRLGFLEPSVSKRTLPLGMSRVCIFACVRARVSVCVWL